MEDLHDTESLMNAWDQGLTVEAGYDLFDGTLFEDDPTDIVDSWDQALFVQSGLSRMSPDILVGLPIYFLFPEDVFATDGILVADHCNPLDETVDDELRKTLQQLFSPSFWHDSQGKSSLSSSSPLCAASKSLASKGATEGPKKKTIIHRDVKSSNILLTESLRAKVADFGFARMGPGDSDQTHISTKVKGTVGYLDPEYLKTYQLTPKSDVFSFGVLLIEILSGRRPVDLRRAPDERLTIKWAFKKYNEGNLRDVMDPSLEEVVDETVLRQLFRLAFRCTASTRADRPAMKEVSEQLWEIRKEYGRTLRRGESTIGDRVKIFSKF
ncbi:hypothetical protein Taro_040681 [Colocasia esculenta]|uniref:Protein kinase domain-containing protein n=1 Tax=Colocasia esculenta TaxID=4460 RepID=A0A843WV84_COLES|nr:hypothetical protein [Colocasia esculenta]